MDQNLQSDRSREARTFLWFVPFTVLSLGIAWQSVRDLCHSAIHDENYSDILVVVPIALSLAFRESKPGR